MKEVLGRAVQAGAAEPGPRRGRCSTAATTWRARCRFPVAHEYPPDARDIFDAELTNHRSEDLDRRPRGPRRGDTSDALPHAGQPTYPPDRCNRRPLTRRPSELARADTSRKVASPEAYRPVAGLPHGSGPRPTCWTHRRAVIRSGILLRPRLLKIPMPKLASPTTMTR